MAVRSVASRTMGSAGFRLQRDDVVGADAVARDVYPAAVHEEVAVVISRRAWARSLAKPRR